MGFPRQSWNILIMLIMDGMENEKHYPGLGRCSRRHTEDILKKFNGIGLMSGLGSEPLCDVIVSTECRISESPWKTM